ncbi:C2H2 type zinc finger domain protein, partial [Aureobasidium melanogenum]
MTKRDPRIQKRFHVICNPPLFIAAAGQLLATNESSRRARSRRCTRKIAEDDTRIDFGEERILPWLPRTVSWACEAREHDREEAAPRYPGSRQRVATLCGHLQSLPRRPDPVLPSNLCYLLAHAVQCCTEHTDGDRAWMSLIGYIVLGNAFVNLSQRPTDLRACWDANRRAISRGVLWQSSDISCHSSASKLVSSVPRRDVLGQEHSSLDLVSSPNFPLAVFIRWRGVQCSMEYLRCGSKNPVLETYLSEQGSQNQLKSIARIIRPSMGNQTLPLQKQSALAILGPKIYDAIRETEIRNHLADTMNSLVPTSIRLVGVNCSSPCGNAPQNQAISIESPDPLHNSCPSFRVRLDTVVPARIARCQQMLQCVRFGWRMGRSCSFSWRASESCRLKARRCVRYQSVNTRRALPYCQMLCFRIDSLTETTFQLLCCIRNTFDRGHCGHLWAQHRVTKVHGKSSRRMRKQLNSTRLQGAAPQSLSLPELEDRNEKPFANEVVKGTTTLTSCEVLAAFVLAGGQSDKLLKRRWATRLANRVFSSTSSTRSESACHWGWWEYGSCRSESSNVACLRAIRCSCQGVDGKRRCFLVTTTEGVGGRRRERLDDAQWKPFWFCETGDMGDWALLSIAYWYWPVMGLYTSIDLRHGLLELVEVQALQLSSVGGSSDSRKLLLELLLALSEEQAGKLELSLAGCKERKQARRASWERYEDRRGEAKPELGAPRPLEEKPLKFDS